MGETTAVFNDSRTDPE